MRSDSRQSQLKVASMHSVNFGRYFAFAFAWVSVFYFWGYFYFWRMSGAHF